MTCKLRRATAFWSVVITLLFIAQLQAEEAERSLEQLLKDFGTGFTIRVVDEQGQPVEGCLAGISRQFSDGKQFVGCNNDLLTTDGQGELALEYGRDYLDEGRVVAWHDDRRLAGFVATTGDDGNDGKPVTVSVRPARWVRGKLTCTKLKPGGEPFGWTNVYVFAEKLRLFGYATEDATYEFLLPPGDYRLVAYGMYVHGAKKPLHVEPGSSDIVVDPIDLPPSQLGLLRGKPAPELRGVVAWKNSAGVELADLKCRYVLLDFWGHWCRPCLAQMPKLSEIRDRFPADKLAIIGVHVGIEGKEEVDTVEELDVALTETRNGLWKGRDIPFPIALVKAEPTRHIEAEGEAQSRAAADYGVGGYPTTILIDPDGRVVNVADALVYTDEGRAKFAEMLNTKGEQQ